MSNSVFFKQKKNENKTTLSAHIVLLFIVLIYVNASSSFTVSQGDLETLMLIHSLQPTAYSFSDTY
jgi:hypothetical protein